MNLAAIKTLLPGMIEWVETTKSIHQENSKPISEFHLPHVDLYFSEELLSKVQIVPIDQLPIPP